MPQDRVKGEQVHLCMEEVYREEPCQANGEDKGPVGAGG